MALSANTRVYDAMQASSPVKMVLARASVVRIGLALLLLHTVGAVVISHDNSAVCQSIVPQCEAKCKGQDYIFVCAAGNGPMGTPYVICRCANPAPPVGGPQQSELQQLVEEKLGGCGEKPRRLQP